MFQSPRSGKFESNEEVIVAAINEYKFQSPRSGKFESNDKNGVEIFEGDLVVSIP